MDEQKLLEQNRWSDAPEASLGEAERLMEVAIGKDGKDAYAHNVDALAGFFNKDYEQWAVAADRALAPI